MNYLKKINWSKFYIHASIVVGVLFVVFSTFNALQYIYAADGDGDGLDDALDACNNLDAPIDAVAYWGFEETTGTTANDSFSSSNGTLTNMTGSEWTAGLIGGALEFDGVDDHIVLPASAGLDSQGSIAIWFKLDDPAGNNILWVDTDNGWNENRIFVSSNVLWFNGYDDAYQYKLTTPFTDTTSWHFVVGTFKDDEAILYLDGTQVDIDTSVNMRPYDHNILALGYYNLIGGSYLDGYLDDVALFDRALTSTEVATMYSNGNISGIGFCYFTDKDNDGLLNTIDSCTDSQAPSSLVSYWGFNEDSGSVAADSFGSNNGTLINDAAFDVSGQLGNALDLDGTGDYVSVSDDNSLDLTDEITLMAWVNADSVANNPTILRKGNEATSVAYGLQLETDNNLRFFFKSGEISYNSSISAPVSTGAWHQVAATYVASSGQVELFVDGISQGTEVLSVGTSLPVSADDLLIGRAAGSTTYDFAGVIDEVAIFDQVLTRAEVSAMYYNSENEDKGYCEETTPFCSNGFIETDEQCDDNNLVNSDGCSDACVIETSYDCTGQPSSCSYVLDSDGDSVMDAFDACDSTGVAPMSNLIGYWAFEEGYGDVAYDSSGSEDGDLRYNPIRVTGQVGEGLQLDGGGTSDGTDSARVSLTDDVFNALTQGTIMAWVSYDRTDNLGNNTIVSSSQCTTGFGANRLYLRVAPTNQLHFQVRDGGGNLVDVKTDETIPEGVLTHVAVTVGPAGNALYINGQAKPVTYTNGNSATTAFFDDIGVSPQRVAFGSLCHSSLFRQNFKGIIDEVALFGVPLTPSEIEAMYQQGQSSLNYCGELDDDGDGVRDVVDACEDGLSPADMVSYWGFDESVETVAQDSLRNRPGTLVNMDGSEWTTGQLRNALTFDGVDDYVRIPDTDALSFGNGATDQPFSISSWINMTDASSFWIAGKGDVFEREYFLGTAANDALVFMIVSDGSDGTNKLRGDTGALTAYQGSWVHVTATYDGSGTFAGMKVYLNGSEESLTDLGTGTYTAMINSDHDFIIGAWATSFANGLIDDLAVFSRELQADEISQMYQNGDNQRNYCAGVIYSLGGGLDIEIPLGANTSTDPGSGDVTVSGYNSNPIVTFPSGTTGTIRVATSKTNSGGGLTVIKGAVLPGGESKTVYVDKIGGSGQLCLNDTEGVSSVSNACSGASETEILCPGTVGDYSCADLGSQYQLAGLTNTAVGEIVVAGGTSESTSVGGTKFYIENAIRNPRFWINSGAKSTSSSEVILTFEVEKAKQMIISNSPDFVETDWQPYKKELKWTLSDNNPAFVYAYFKNETSTSPMVAQVIELTNQKTSDTSFFLMLIAALLGLGGMAWVNKKPR
ncbi:LamG-like jellyroll fold domain-containing protein [Patescibacteria group bacterium]